MGPSRGRRADRPRGWKVDAELPGTAAFAAATRFVRPDDVARAIPCGPDVDAVRPFVDAGFTHLAFAERELLPAPGEECGRSGAPAIRVR